MDLLINLLQVALEHSATMSIYIGKGLLLWTPLALVVCLMLYFLARYRGWLESGGATPRWAKLIYAAVLLVLVLPLLSMQGVVCGVRDGLAEVLVQEVREYKLPQTVGLVVLVPVVMGHLAAEADVQKQQDGTVDIEKLLQQAWEQKQTAFLLDPKLRQRAIAKLTQEFVQAALREARLDEKFAKTRMLKWLVSYMEAKIVSAVVKKMELYDSLLQEVKSEGDGKLSLTTASEQVGEHFLRRFVISRVLGVFNTFRLQLAFLALALWLIAIFMLRLANRWLAKHALSAA